MLLLKSLAAALRRPAPVVRIERGAVIRPGDLVVVFDALSGPGAAMRHAVQSALPAGARVLYLPCAPAHLSVVNATRLIEAAADERTDDRAGNGHDQPPEGFAAAHANGDPTPAHSGDVPAKPAFRDFDSVGMPVPPEKPFPHRSNQ